MKLENRYARLIIKIEDEYTKTCVKFIELNSLKNYEISDCGRYIYRYLTWDEYNQQLAMVDKLWHAPEIGRDAIFDDVYFEEEH
jgi:hypothetical protein